MEDILQKITTFADFVHADQVRKYSRERYIAHPVRVMECCRRYSNDISLLSAALLHDVLEDTNVGREPLRDFLLSLVSQPVAEKTMTIVTELTDVFVKSAYPKLNRRQRKNKELDRLEKISPDAQLIKYADIIDNCMKIVDEDPDFAKVYLYECRAILRRLDKGNKDLHNEAVKTVDERIMSLTGNKL